jgi:cytochrome c oxidase cbb3-type subunit III
MITVNRTRFMKSKFALPVIALLLPLIGHAQKTAETESTGYMSNGVFLVMAAVIVMLMLVIVGLAELVKAGASQRVTREKKLSGAHNDVQSKDHDSVSAGDESSPKSQAVKSAVVTAFFLAVSSALMAQDAAAVPAAEIPAGPPFNYWGLGAQLFLVMLAVIVFELIIIYVLYRTGIRLLREEKPVKSAVAASFMESRLMKSITGGDQTPEEEAAILTDHDYDGIRELDNNLPAWWKYGFYLTIVVAVVYIFNYHVLDTGLSSVEEYDKEVHDAEIAIAEYKRNNANSVDENNVVQLIDAASVQAGGSLYSQNCVACHGTAGEGKEGLGPNLTDDYWLHKGGIVNVFKSIKYGWTDKGMKSWEQDLKPLEIQQVASYILTLRGSNPANAKPAEGELFLEEGQQADSTGARDSVPAPTLSAQNK